MRRAQAEAPEGELEVRAARPAAPGRRRPGGRRSPSRWPASSGLPSAGRARSRPARESVQNLGQRGLHRVPCPAARITTWVSGIGALQLVHELNTRRRSIPARPDIGHLPDFWRARRPHRPPVAEIRYFFGHRVRSAPPSQPPDSVVCPNSSATISVVRSVNMAHGSVWS